MSKKLVGAQLDLELIDNIDQVCKTLSITRSEFLRRAIEMFLATVEPVTETQP